MRNVDFKIKLANRDMPDAQLIEDLQRIATELGKSPTKDEYTTAGQFNATTLIRRFGSWREALEAAGLSHTPKIKVVLANRNTPDEALLVDLRRVAVDLDKSPTMAEYNRAGEYNASTLVRRFGNWFKALEAATLPPSRPPINIPEDDLLRNVLDVWTRLGRQPRYAEMDDRSLSAFSAGTYANRFGSWGKALRSFERYVNATDERQPQPPSSENERLDTPVQRSDEQETPPRSGPRKAGAKLRWQVFQRDSFRCVACGAFAAEVELHADHKVPWSKGGETVLDNLQSLCAQCNLGKGSLDG